jgi:integrase/recombinase XerD
MLAREPIEQFLSTLEAQKGFSGNTLAAYRNDLSQFAGYLDQEQEVERYGGRPDSWSNVTRNNIIAFLLYLKEQRKAATTVARKQAAIKSFFKFLSSRGIVASNPVEDLASPHVDRALPQTINAGEVERLLHEMDTAPDSPEVLRDRAMMQLLYATGLRVGETVALDVRDVDLGDNTVSTSGRGKTRRVSIGSRATLNALADYLEKGRPALARLTESRGAALADAGDDNRALFLNHRGQRLTRQGFWLILKRYANLAGLGEISPHTLRHSFAAQKLNSGTDMRDLQQILGHANISTTQVYARIGQKNERSKGKQSNKRNMVKQGNQGNQGNGGNEGSVARRKKKVVS